MSADILEFNSRRSTVYGTKHAVASSNPLATQAGMDILLKGGNAADAAVGVAAVLNVVEPFSTGLGGDCFCLFYDAKTKSVSALNGSGRSPRNLTLDDIKRDIGDNQERIPLDSPHSVTVPGAAAGWVDTVERFGSGRVTLGDILEPAIYYGENGFPVSQITAHHWDSSAETLKSASNNYNELLINGEAPKVGEFFKNPYLARTLRLLVENGKDGFYKGPVGEAIINAIQEAGGKMCLDDLENHKTAFVDPIHYEHNGFKVYECPPNGQGIVALQALGVLDSLVEDGKIPDIGKIQHNSAEYLHILIECLRLAFADAFHYVADPDHIPDPQLLLSRDYLKTRADLFNHDVKNECITNGELPISCDTVYFSVVDQDGNGCSFINSTFHSFGGIIPKGCGFTLQNRGCGFSLNTQGYNLYQPEKRPYHTIIPSMITKNDELHAVFGVMGGYMQPQGHLQVLLNLLHFGMDPQRSLDQPRFCIDVFEDIVFIEDGIDSIEAVESALKRKGHNIIVKKSYERAVFGRGQVIIRSSSQSKKHAEKPLNTGDSLGSACEDSIILAVGSDPRSDGCASAR